MQAVKFAVLPTAVTMRFITRFLDSSIGKKILMSLTGLFLCLFLIVHVTGNLQLFRDDHGLAFNQYTVFMTTFPVIKLISYLLYATFLIHVFNGFRLVLINRKARQVGYNSRKDPRSSTWASKNMGLLGFILLLFLVTHMANFWYAYKFGEVPWKMYQVEVLTQVVREPVLLDESQIPAAPFEVTGSDALGVPVKNVVVKDLYEVVYKAFSAPGNWWLVVFYVVGMVALAYHLVHGFQSAFQTLGIRPPAYAPLIRGIGVWIFGIIIPLLFAAMPLYFYFIKA
jgi:succinate dehydrogenase / fumarate reductase cytochrome b subunit